MSWLRKFKTRIENFDIFALGNSAVLYYCLIFGTLSFLSLLPFISQISPILFDKRLQLPNFQAIFYLMLGIFSFILGYNLSIARIFTKRIPNILKKEWNAKRVFIVFILVFVAGLMIKFLRISGGAFSHLGKSTAFLNSSFYSLVGLLDWLGPVALAIAFAYYFYLLKINNPRYKIWQIIAWLTFAVEFLFGFFSLSRFSVVIPIIIYLIIRHYLCAKSYWRIIMAVFIILLAIMPLMNFYRNAQNSLRPYPNIANNQIEVKYSAIGQFVADSSLSRIDQSRILTAVFQKTENFLYGKSLLNFFISLGPPRFLWKDKPVIAGGNEFGRQYGILATDDFKNSVGPTVIGDWYMNFGLAGIILGMFLMGIIFKTIYLYFVKEANYSLSGVVIYSILWIQIIKGTEDFIAPVWAGMVKLFVILLIIHFFLVDLRGKTEGNKI